MNRFISVLAVIVLSMAVFGCQNIFKSIEVLDNKDKAEQSKIAQQKGDNSQVISYTLDELKSSGYNPDVATKAISEKDQELFVDLAKARLSDIGVSLLDAVSKVAEAAGSSNAVTDNSVLTTISDALPPTQNIDEVLLNAKILRLNVDTSNANEALNAATMEIVATSMLATVAFDSDGDGKLSPTENNNTSTSTLLAQWDTVSTNILDHANGAVDLLDYTSVKGNSDISEATQTLDDLNALNLQRGTLTDDQFAQQLKNILFK